MLRSAARTIPANLALIGVVCAIVGAPSVAYAAFSSEEPAPAGLPALIGLMTSADWGFVALGTVIVFGILGPRLARDIQGWLR